MQHSSKPFSRFLAIPLLAGIAVLGVAAGQPAPPDASDPELREDLSAADIRPASDVPPDASGTPSCARSSTGPSSARPGPRKRASRRATGGR